MTQTEIEVGPIASKLKQQDEQSKRRVSKLETDQERREAAHYASELAGEYSAKLLCIGKELTTFPDNEYPQVHSIKNDLKPEKSSTYSFSSTALFRIFNNYRAFSHIEKDIDELIRTASGMTTEHFGLAGIDRIRLNIRLAELENAFRFARMAANIWKPYKKAIYAAVDKITPLISLFDSL